MALPDPGNFDFGDQPIPDNFLDNTLEKALTQHQRKESQIASVEQDFASVLEPNVATNIAANLIGYIHPDGQPQAAPPAQQSRPVDPDEDDVRYSNDDDENSNKAKEYGLDEMLIETVTAHKHRDSRTDFVQQKLHEMFPQDPEDDLIGSGVTAGQGADGKIDMSTIATNLVAFLHDDGTQPSTPNNNEAAAKPTAGRVEKNKKARGSTDLTDLQQEIDDLNARIKGLETQLKSKEDESSELGHRVHELENKNAELLKEVRYLQDSKTTLLMNSTKCIDELRGLLICYQKQLNVTSSD
mmetsp:Transcript_31070/g.49909  ORF Transcript_31070/g.49909 Transcript_31070/m.49909 type:complete len:298 (+) Transcript_31070:125-1018(+)|eukprot:CAMPEP_0197023714 /NCGR_PEP_ID=MMETSP1384-20130603/4369_1 /TAXON_ID=29189 /ORGANISM="Ammonia sp." /LENGTH=297 /DNA_ID=CAMNT_0042451967 /DNA_START=122 /DNA_END=1015 /DNA_ORIENTATION=-